MPTLEVNEYAGAGLAQNRLINAPLGKGSIHQKRTLTTTSANVAALTTHSIVELYSDVDAFVSWDGTAADTTDFRLPAGIFYPLILDPGTQIAARSVS